MPFKHLSGDISNDIGTTPTHFPGLRDAVREGVTDAKVNAERAVSDALRFNASAGTSPRGQTNILEFPMDVASGDAALGNHGHYIMFYINEQDKAQLSMSDRASGGSVAENLAKPYKIPSFIRQYSAQSEGYQKQRNQDVLIKRNVNDNLSPGAGGGNLSKQKEN